jgi:hypothetical protein
MELVKNIMLLFVIIILSFSCGKDKAPEVEKDNHVTYDQALYEVSDIDINNMWCEVRHDHMICNDHRRTCWLFRNHRILCRNKY